MPARPVPLRFRSGHYDDLCQNAYGPALWYLFSEVVGAPCSGTLLP
jgi:hypothetical protein